MSKISTLGGALAATALLGASFSGAAQADDTVATSETVSTSSAKTIAEFWLENNGAALKAAGEYTSTQETTPVSKLVSTGGYSADTKAGLVAPTGTTTTTSTSKNINLPKTIGKVFFVQDGVKKWCSASSIQSAYKNLVATAGHCVYDPSQNEGLLDNWVFVPAYYQGKAPYGLYVGKQAYVHYDFSVYEDYDRDYAFVTVYNGVTLAKQSATSDDFVGANTGYSLGATVGGQGFAWNQPTKKAHYVFGYPADAHPDGNKPYTGITPKWCYGKTTAKTVGSTSKKIEEHVALKCAMTGGADGGPWLVKYSNSKRIGYLNGVTSTFNDQDGNDRVDYLSSAYFDGETYSVYTAAASAWSGNLF